MAWNLPAAVHAELRMALSLSLIASLYWDGQNSSGGMLALGFLGLAILKFSLEKWRGGWPLSPQPPPFPSRPFGAGG